MKTKLSSKAIVIISICIPAILLLAGVVTTLVIAYRDRIPVDFSSIETVEEWTQADFPESSKIVDITYEKKDSGTHNRVYYSYDIVVEMAEEDVDEFITSVHNAPEYEEKTGELNGFLHREDLEVTRNDLLYVGYVDRHKMLVEMCPRGTTEQSVIISVAKKDGIGIVQVQIW